MQGMLERIDNVAELKNGTGARGAWTLYGTHLIVDGVKYGLTSFKRAEVEAKISTLKAGSIIEFDVEEDGKFKNVAKGTAIKVIKEGSGIVTEQSLGRLDDKEIEAKWKESAEFVIQFMIDKGLSTDFEKIGPSVSTLFMKKMEAGKRK